MKSSPKTQRIIMVMLFVGVISGLLFVMFREKEGFAVSNWVGGSWLNNGCTKVEGENKFQSKIMGKCGDVVTTLNAEDIKQCPHYDEKWKPVEKNAAYKYINLVRGPDDRLLCN